MHEWLTLILSRTLNDLSHFEEMALADGGAVSLSLDDFL